MVDKKTICMFCFVLFSLLNIFVGSISAIQTDSLPNYLYGEEPVKELQIFLQK